MKHKSKMRLQIIGVAIAFLLLGGMISHLYIDGYVMYKYSAVNKEDVTEHRPNDSTKVIQTEYKSARGDSLDGIMVYTRIVRERVDHDGRLYYYDDYVESEVLYVEFAVDSVKYDTICYTQVNCNP